MKKRTKWLDVLRCFGIFLIYVGHFPHSAGNAVEYVFTHHVPLFFFAAGCAENFYADRDFLTTAKKTILNLLVPWAFFAVLSLVLNTVEYNLAAHKVLRYIKVIAKGTIRNKYLAGSLWFLTGMAVVRMLFFFIKKVRFKWLMLLIGMALFYYAALIMKPAPSSKPSLPYNVDSALYYIIYYVIGYISFPHLDKLLDGDKIWKKCVLAVTFAISVFFAGCTFFKEPILKEFLRMIPGVKIYTSVINALTMIWMYCVLAKIFENIPLLNKIGQNTLYLCGNEYTIKHLFPAVMSIVGLQINMASPLVVYIYCIVLILLVNQFLVPIEKTCITQIQKWLEGLLTIRKKKETNKIPD